jgi:hypothetical protein
MTEATNVTAPAGAAAPAAPAATAPAAPAAPALPAGSHPTHAKVEVQKVDAPVVKSETPPAETKPAEPAKPAETKPAEQPKTDYKIPDAYKDKPWAAKIKSDEDLWKQLESAQTLIGKKTIAPIDFKTATPEDIQKYYETMRPAEKSAYKFAEGSDEKVKEVISDIFFENGVSEVQANKILEKYQGMEAERMAEAVSADGFKAAMTKSFGEKYEADVAAVVKSLDKHMSAEDKAIMENTPNEFLGMIYRNMRAEQKAHEAEIAALKTKYGIKETPDAHLEEQGSSQGQDLTAIRTSLRAEIAALSNRMHTQAEKDVLIEKLNNTYKTQTQRK